MIHISTPTCFGTKVQSSGIYYNEVIPATHANPRSAPLCRNKQNFKMLKYIRLMTINYSRMILKIKICNISRHNGHLFVVYIGNGLLIQAAFLVTITWRLFALALYIFQSGLFSFMYFVKPQGRVGFIMFSLFNSCELSLLVQHLQIFCYS